ncbi:MAG TPA: hypothetical protein VGP08_01115 [Pyrinomonadaceae bacterium]|jgi:hypothetical protein|nr:hypothetical protein [Pyrinomonadaceae bacterium]
MIKDSLNAIADSTRATLRGWRGLLVLALLYLVPYACVYLFFSTGQATAWQLVLSGLTALVAPLLLLVLIAATATFALPERQAAVPVARGGLRDSWKVLLLALPVAALGWGLFYLLGKLQEHLPKVEDARRAILNATPESRVTPLYWQEALMSWLWIILFGVVLPLLAAHLWLGVARDGLKTTVSRIHRVAARAFAPRAVLVYIIGFFVFALLPYFVLYTRTAVTNGWAELLMFGLRIAVTFVLTLLGWTITLGALARTTPPETLAHDAAAEAPPPVETLPHAEAPPAPPPSVTGEAV